MSGTRLGKRIRRRKYISPMDSTDDEHDDTRFGKQIRRRYYISPTDSSGDDHDSDHDMFSEPSPLRPLMSSTRKAPKKSVVTRTASARRPTTSVPLVSGTTRTSLHSTVTVDKKIIAETPIALDFVPGAFDKGISCATVPKRGVSTAVDHQEHKLYLLTYHLDDIINDEEPGSTIHCLDLKTMLWDDSVRL
jgi:hypothetical protein